MIPEAATVDARAVDARMSGSMAFRAAAALQRFLSRAATARRERKLRLCETLSLGEKRFLAVVQVDRQQFLVGGAGNSISLLTQLPAEAADPLAGPESTLAAR